MTFESWCEDCGYVESWWDDDAWVCGECGFELGEKE